MSAITVAELIEKLKELPPHWKTSPTQRPIYFHGDGQRAYVYTGNETTAYRPSDSAATL